MVSRTPRHQSQPRPSMPHKSSSIDAWDHANANSNMNTKQQRRSQSSMRYQSNGRNPSRTRAREVIDPGMVNGRPSSTRHLHSNSQSGNNFRPRAISAGRLREGDGTSTPGRNSNHDDPSAVARQILDLRERRESSIRSKRSQLNPPGHSSSKRPTSSIPSHISAQILPAAAGGTSPTGLVLKAVNSSMSQEEIQAEERLKRAENKIGGMLEDLEELKFFQEIEMEAPGPSTPRTPKRATRPNSNKKPNGLPTMIRAASPARGGRLPPPPTQNNTKKAGGLETYRPLSPRSIARLDRNSLELECQTIVRKLQILEQELFSHQATIEMYEITLQEHDNDKTKINRLEGELQKVSTELRKQLYNIQKGKESLVKDYEEKLQNNLQKLHRTQEKADSYQADLHVAKSAAQKLEGEVEKYRSLAAKEKAKIDGMLSNEETLNLQLVEARNLNATLVKKVEKKRSEVSELKEDLSKSTKRMEESNRDLEDAHESQVTLLEQQLNMSKDRYSRLEQECTERNAAIVEKEKELNEARVKHSVYEDQIEQMCKEMELLQKEAETKFEEGKKASKVQETRNAQKLVAERANASREYEQRIKAMQEQLRHQTDRHHKEIEETRIRNQKNLESMKDDLREEIRAREGDKVNRLESELSSLKRNYDEEKLRYSSRLQDVQQKARSAAEEFQHQDQMRQQELDHLHGRLNSYFNDFTEKDNQILRLKERLEESKQIREDLENTQREQNKDLEKYANQLEEERVKFVETKKKLDQEIETMKVTQSKVENDLLTEIKNLRDEVDDGRTKLADANALLGENDGLKQNLETIQVELSETKRELLSERSHTEVLETDLRLKISKLEGQLRTSHSALQDKTTQVETLAKELDVATLLSSKEGEEKQNEIISLRKQLQDMNKLEDDLQDLKRTLIFAENEKKKREEELLAIKSSYESTRSKVLEVEQRYSSSKEEFNKRLETKEVLLERYEKSIKDLEFALERERSDSDCLKTSIKDLKVENDRYESDLVSLRKDYEELTGLLEENLHSSAKKDEVDLMLRKKETELRETVDIYNRQFAELESKMMEKTKNIEELKMKNSSLQTTLDKIKAEKLKIFNDLTKVQKDHDGICRELEEIKDEQQTTLRGISENIGKKDSHLREAVQRYTRTIANLETKLEEETQSKLELEDRLSSARSELKDKQEQTQEIVQRHTKATKALETKFGKASAEREKLKTQLDLVKRGLSEKELELSEALKNRRKEVASADNARGFSYSSPGKSLQQEQKIVKMKEDIDELRESLNLKSAEYREMKIAFDRNETELNQRKEQVNELVSKYTDRIAELEAELEEHSDAMTNRDDKVETAQAQSERKDTKIRELLKSIAEMEAKLESANRSKESAKQKSESLSKDLSEKESKLRSFEVEKIELETKLHTQARSKDEARAKMSELSSRLERKEREVRELSDRYKIYVMELESKLDQDTDTKHHLQLEIDKLRNNLDSATEVSTEALELRQKVKSLEITVASSNEKATSLQSKLGEASKSRKAIDAALQKANSEKAEVIAALEGVINEVQNREDEIESLSELLQRRDEELQHAKIIATKALASAKDIQKRYKDKSEGRHSDLMGRVNEVSDNVDRLTTENESLQRKNSSLERDLRDRKLENKRLKDQLRQLDAKQMRENIKDDISAISTQSTEFSAFSNQAHSELGFDQPISMDSDSFSPTNRVRNTNGNTNNLNDDGFTRQVDFASIDEQFSKDSLENSVNGDGKWQDFDNDSRSGFESVSSEQQSTKSRRSVERDALRKYVRQRYSKRGEKS